MPAEISVKVLIRLDTEKFDGKPAKAELTVSLPQWHVVILKRQWSPPILGERNLLLCPITNATITPLTRPGTWL